MKSGCVSIKNNTQRFADRFGMCVCIFLEPPPYRRPESQCENSSHRLFSCAQNINRKMIDANEVTVSFFFRRSACPKTLDGCLRARCCVCVHVSSVSVQKSNHFSFGNKIIFIVIEFHQLLFAVAFCCCCCCCVFFFIRFANDVRSFNLRKFIYIHFNCFLSYIFFSTCSVYTRQNVQNIHNIRGRK